MHKRLSHLVLEGEGLNEILLNIQSTIQTPTFLFDNLGEILIYCKGQELEIDINKVRKYIEPHLSDNSPVEEQFISKKINNQIYHISLLPIGSKVHLLGYLATFSLNRLNEIDKSALKHACTIISLELAKEQNLLEMEQNLKGEFIEELFQEKSINENLRKRALQLNLQHNRLFQVVYINYEQLMQQYENKKNTHFTINKRLLSLAHYFFLSGYATGMVVNRNNHIVLLLSFNNDFTQERAISFLKEKSRMFSSKLGEDFYGLSPSIGVGGLVEGLNNVFKSSQQALKCLSYIKNQKVDESVLFYDELGAKRLYLNNSDEELIDFIMDTLGPLLHSKNQQKEEYIETLLTYVENNQKLKETAKQLHIHLNTLSYRIKKIESMLGMSFQNNQDLLNLYLAINMYELMRNKISS
jgi:sugar diacid utilization regulator